MSGNAVMNPDFSRVTDGKPDGWEERCPREALSPVYGYEPSAICLSGGGNPHVFGWWSQVVDVREGKTYRFRVKMSFEGIEDVNLNIFNVLSWIKSDGSTDYCYADHLSTYRREGDFVIGEDSFEVPRGCAKAEIQMGIRFSGGARVCWHEARLEETEPPKRRYARITTCKYAPYLSMSRETNLQNIGECLDRAGALSSDLAVLPEFVNMYDRKAPIDQIAERISDGPTCRLVGEKAAEHGMYVCAGIVEREGDFLYNAALLFDRKGAYVGKYRKTHPYWLEEMRSGLTPGDEYPVFDLDFGRVGIVICYDAFYAEIFRILALKGAELVLYVNDGMERLLVPARAIDNRIYIAVSTIGRSDPDMWDMPAMIVDPSGNILAESNAFGLVSAEIEISYRPPNRRILRPWNGGTMCTSPGGRRSSRNALSNRLYRELMEEMGQWENRPESFYYPKPRSQA